MSPISVQCDIECSEKKNLREIVLEIRVCFIRFHFFIVIFFLDIATSHLRLDPDWPSILLICDLIRQNDAT